jgi:hypothetical protein
MLLLLRQFLYPTLVDDGSPARLDLLVEGREGSSVQATIRKRT